MLDWIARVKHILLANTSKQTQNTSAHVSNAPKEIHKGKKRIKDQISTHWDLDYLSKQELEKIYSEKDKK
jgi:hypothetical protein